MNIRQNRIEKDFAAIARFGALEGGGVTRLAFTEADLEARAYLHEAMEEAGLAVSVDAFGNMRGRRPGLEDLPPVLIGSHLDTVPEGGHYDGIVGVLAALEVVRVLNDGVISTRRPVEVVNFSAEESSRFGVATLGSKVMTGRISGETLRKLSDADGVSLLEALERAGHDPDGIESARIMPGEVHAFLELHIEQGPVLEREGCPIGIVSAIAAPTRFRVVVSGRADHSGTTPMDLRKDALAGAAEIVIGVEWIGAHDGGETTVATVGYLRVEPGVMNVVPGRVELGIDIRDIDAARKRDEAKKIVELMEVIAARRGLSLDIETLSEEDPVALPQRLIGILDREAAAAGLSIRKMPSGAGHDAMNMASVTEAGMIFVPSIGGISHNILERSRMEDIARGTELLLRATLTLAME